MPIPSGIPSNTPPPESGYWAALLTVFGPFLLSGLMAFCAQLFKQMVKIPRDTLLRIFFMSTGAAVMAVASHAILTDTTPLSDTTLIGIAGVFGYIGSEGIKRAMTYNIRKRTGIELEPDDEKVMEVKKDEPNGV